jgi:hypothetical protein
MIRFLVALYPKEWRGTYGHEFAAMLEQTRLTPRTVLDVLVQAAKFHVSVHRSWLLVGAAVLVSVVIEIIARTAGLTANVLWPPTTPARTAGLLALVAPWAALAVRRRIRSRRPPVRS